MFGECLEIAVAQQQQFEAATDPVHRKARGHFGTPPGIARYMAEMFPAIPSGTVRILDAGAGTGILSAAICQRMLGSREKHHAVFELWESDPLAVPLLTQTMRKCRQLLIGAGHRMEFAIRVDDFVLANSQKTLFDSGSHESFHWAILNPPYFKLRRDSVHSRAMKHLVHGQPNIYALFLAAAGDLLLPQGEIVAITPRSYFNGSYFQRFRRWFFDRFAIRQIHSFESRSEAFKRDAVLQENVILRAKKGGIPETVVISSSSDGRFHDLKQREATYEQVIDNSHGDQIVRVATSQLEQEIMERMDRLPDDFASLGFEISTGPVVTFRSTEFLRQERTADTAPLLWMHNIRPFEIRFPPRNGKPTHIRVCNSSQKLLVPAGQYILLKRFTSKEEKRRLIAGIMHAEDSYSSWVGLENHLNYVYRRGTELTDAEALGLAAFFNSSLVDRYFRLISGNTQVNATEIRRLPVPDLSALCRIGQEVKAAGTKQMSTIERIVGHSVDLPAKLIDTLEEVE